MPDLTRLERAALAEIARQHPTLAPQAATARVTVRENTGCGFFTTLAVDPAAAAAIEGPRVLGNVWLDVEGLEHPMTFLVFMEGGYMQCLEGATVGDSTETLDLGALVSAGVHEGVRHG